MGSKNASSPHSFKLKSHRSRSHYNNPNQINQQRIGTLALSMDEIEANRRSEDPRPITAPDNVNNVPNKLNIHTDSGHEIKPENVN